MFVESVVIFMAVAYMVIVHDSSNQTILVNLVTMVFPLIALYWMYLAGFFSLSFYRVKTAARGAYRLYNMPTEDKLECVRAYEFLQKMQAGLTPQEKGEYVVKTNTDEETDAVRRYYNVLNEILSIADIEKLYIPPLLDEFSGLYHNQILCERELLDELKLANPSGSHLLDMGCGRGRISHHMHTLTKGKVSGYNIDPNQIQNAIDYAAETGTSSSLEYKVGDHHKPLPYPDSTFDAVYSFQAVWPFFKPHELDGCCQEMFRVMKPGARYACSEYLLTPAFDWTDQEHVTLHRLYLPTLAATHSLHPHVVCEALERAGFEIILSAPSKGPAWVLCEQKRDLILSARKVVRFLTYIGIFPEFLEHMLRNLQLGGQAWTDAEKRKIADLNWRIVCRKPLA